MIDEEMKKVKVSGKGSKKSKGFKRIPFVVTYHSSLNCLSCIIKDNLNILCMIREAKALLSPGTMVSFRRARRISSYLVRAKFNPLERCVGSRRCKKRRYEVCTDVKEIDTFCSTVTGKTF